MLPLILSVFNCFIFTLIYYLQSSRKLFCYLNIPYRKRELGENIDSKTNYYIQTKTTCDEVYTHGVHSRIIIFLISMVDPLILFSVKF